MQSYYDTQKDKEKYMKEILENLRNDNTIILNLINKLHILDPFFNIKQYI